MHEKKNTQGNHETPTRGLRYRKSERQTQRLDVLDSGDLNEECTEKSANFKDESRLKKGECCRCGIFQHGTQNLSSMTELNWIQTLSTNVSKIIKFCMMNNKCI